MNEHEMLVLFIGSFTVLFAVLLFIKLLNPPDDHWPSKDESPSMAISITMSVLGSIAANETDTTKRALFFSDIYKTMESLEAQLDIILESPPQSLNK